MNHLALTLACEEPDVTTVAIRPGVVDTDMQRDIREVYHKAMGDKESERFFTMYKEGQILKPEQPGNVMARLVLDATKELNGKFLRYVCNGLAYGSGVSLMRR